MGGECHRLCPHKSRCGRVRVSATAAVGRCARRGARTAPQPSARHHNINDEKSGRQTASDSAPVELERFLRQHFNQIGRTMPHKVPLVFTCGNGLMSTVCCLSCFHIPNWAELACVCACPCLAAMDDDSNERYNINFRHLVRHHFGPSLPPASADTIGRVTQRVAWCTRGTRRVARRRVLICALPAALCQNWGFQVPRSPDGHVPAGAQLGATGVQHWRREWVHTQVALWPPVRCDLQRLRLQVRLAAKRVNSSPFVCFRFRCTITMVAGNHPGGWNSEHLEVGGPFATLSRPER